MRASDNISRCWRSWYRTTHIRLVVGFRLPRLSWSSDDYRACLQIRGSQQHMVLTNPRRRLQLFRLVRLTAYTIPPVAVQGARTTRIQVPDLEILPWVADT